MTTSPPAAAESVGASTFRVGDLVTKNPATWRPSDFDSWGRGTGVGVVVESPIPLDADEVDVRWPSGRCFEDISGLLLATDANP